MNGDTEQVLRRAQEEEDADPGTGSTPRTFFVLNRVYIDDLRAAMGILEGGAKR